MSGLDPISRLNAALDGRYRVASELGRGGMATVYLAADLRHGRKVAVKVLKPELAAIVGAERFLTEIKTTANLQHPHILPLFDSGEADTFLFYVMPFVEGESLRHRLDREHQLPVDEAVRIATNVAEALDYAHSQGVIHRDVKPANILLQAGKPVIADFGIALALGAAGGHRLTETGLSVGTPQYMSPEQATGDQGVGAATDTYSLACVLYEMLVGEPPYTGSTPQAILGKIIQGKLTSATEVRPMVPAHVDGAIRRALEKVPADRFARASDFGRALGDTGFRHGDVEHVASRAGTWNGLTVAGWSVAALLGLGLGWSVQRPAAPRPGVSRQVLSTEAWSAVSRSSFGEYAALAPDGSSVLLPLEDRLGLKLRGSAEVVPLAGTEGARNAVYSPDGDWIVFALGRELHKLPVTGGSSIRLAGSTEPPPQRVGLDWLDDGTILYERQEPSGRLKLVRIESGGGSILAEFDAPGDGALAWVRGLPGSAGALAVTIDNRLFAVDLRDGAAELIRDDVIRAWYAATGHLVYVRTDGAVLAEPFDADALETRGSVTPLFDGVRATDRTADMHMSADGTVLYVEGPSSPRRQLTVVDLQGNQQVLPLAPRSFPDDGGGVGWSPDGRSIVFASEGQIYTYDVVLNTPPRALTTGGSNGLPAYSPDGTRVAFSSVRGRTADIMVKDLSDASDPRPVITLEGVELIKQWPTDTLIVFDKEIGQTDLWLVDISDPDNPEARPYLTSEATLRNIALSPDGTLAAYQSDESGANEIYVRTFPDPGPSTRISLGGGVVPFWSPDGNTLYYATGRGGTFMAARLRRTPTLAVLATDSLFSVPALESIPGALHPDGDRFILVTPVAADLRPRVILVESFFEELQRVAAN